MVDEPVASPKLAVTRRKWNTFALVGLLLLAGLPVAFLVFAASAYWSPEPVRLGVVTLIGPRSKRVVLFLNEPPWQESGAAGEGSSYITVARTRLPIVRGKHLWRVGPLHVVWH